MAARRWIVMHTVRSLLDFAGNALRQLTNAPAVVRFTLRERMWLAGLFGGLEVRAVLGGVRAMRLERELYDGPKREAPVHRPKRTKKRRS